MAADVELMTAMIALLKADGTIAGYVGDRIFDRVPERQDGEPAVAFPYISFGPTEGVPDRFDCIVSDEIALQLDVWSQGDGEAYASAQCRKISDRVARRLDDAELELATAALVVITHERTLVLRDPDGITHHGVVQFTAIVETP